MGLVDKLIDKIFNRLKKNRMDATVSRVRKANPEFARAMDKHVRTYAEMKKALQKSLPDLYKK